MPVASIPHSPPAVRVAYDRRSAEAGRGERVTIAGRRCVLRLEPDVNTAGAPVVLDLTLRCHGYRQGADLLSSAHRWHGVQPFIFPARDMAAGPERSMGGEARTIAAPALGAVLKVKVRSAVVRPAGADQAWDRLELSVAVRPAQAK